MRFNAVAICMFIIAINSASILLDEFNVLPISNPEAHLPKGDENTSHVSTNTSGSFLSVIGNIIERVFYFAGFVDEDGNIDTGKVSAVVMAVVGFLGTVITSYQSSTGLNILIFGAIFWTTFVIGFKTIEGILISFGWGVLQPIIYMFVGITYILGAMQLSSGGFGNYV